ncbi:MAG TPA: prolyl oligopeptidase family serine peptidase [Terriglobia bacterium]|nr:prolyl oligopeptidase family serine peptidase [Terriglobia bacterium]
MPQPFARLAFLLACLAVAPSLNGADKPPLTLDEFFNSTEFNTVALSPDGHAVVIQTTRADWDRNRFRTDLWLYRDGGGGQAPAGPAASAGLVRLTQSGHDSEPQWSPDGRWVGFISDRVAPGSSPQAPAAEKDDEDDPAGQVWVIAADGGEAFPLTQGKEDVHAFAWSADSRSIYFATLTPRSTEEEEAYKKQWKDVIQFRESERGDSIFKIDLADVLSAATSPAPGDKGQKPRTVCTTPWRVKQLTASPDGHYLAFNTDSRSERQESLDAYNIDLVELPSGTVRLLSHTQAIYDNLAWSPDSRRVFFSCVNGSVEGPYQDVQPRVYSVNIAEASGPKDAPVKAHLRWGRDFEGALADYAVLPHGGLLIAGGLGTEVQPYTQEDSSAPLSRRPGQPGAYETLAAAKDSSRVAFVYSSLQQPSEVYLADSPDELDEARPITAFNRLFTSRALPQGKPYRWKADDGVTVEGMLIYPPGKFGTTHLPMFTLIHGGPADADGNHFEADWYQWAGLAATDGWLVFEPNYRGSTGYGDAFTLGVIGPIVSRPGKDILEGVDQLVHDGTADPGHLTVGGYSYGGYMTNWLITQTSRFKAAVSGAGAVEHVANWGNDDTTFDDAYFLGGVPWKAKQNYNAEAAIWQFDKVTTPTHVVGGADDIRVYVGEDYLLERALYMRGIPTALLIFPGEGHPLSKNPWHGKIKVREELKWLDKYGKP